MNHLFSQFVDYRRDRILVSWNLAKFIAWGEIIQLLEVTGGSQELHMKMTLKIAYIKESWYIKIFQGGDNFTLRVGEVVGYND